MKLRTRKLTAKQAQSHFSNHPIQLSSWNGVRDDIDPWVRKDGEHHSCTLKNSQIIESAQWAHARRGRGWTLEDADLYEEIDRRAFGWGEAQRQRFFQEPSWATPELIPARRCMGYGRFLWLLSHAFRTGAIGVLLSYEESMALCGISSRSTWRRWTEEMESLGLIRIIQTWTEGPHDGAARQYARLLYRIGPKLEEAAGYGIVEGAAPDETRERWAKRAAMGARARARAYRKARKAEIWQVTRPEKKQDLDPEPAKSDAEGGVAPIVAVRFLDSTPPTFGSEAPAEGRPETSNYCARSARGILATPDPKRRPRIIENKQPPDIARTDGRTETQTLSGSGRGDGAARPPPPGANSFQSASAKKFRVIGPNDAKKFRTTENQTGRSRTGPNPEENPLLDVFRRAAEDPGGNPALRSALLRRLKSSAKEP